MKPGILLGFILLTPSLPAGPYSAGVHDPSNPHDAPVPGFIGPDGIGKPRLDDGQGGAENPNNYVNPLFFAWADAAVAYQCSDPNTAAAWRDPGLALGPVTGDNFDIVALGDLTSDQISANTPPGTITLRLAQPVRNRSGADLVVFENSFYAQYSTGGSGIGGLFAELAYFEVSPDGITFHRFPSLSQNPSSVGAYGSINPSNVFNLAGKHANAYGESWGTPFDLGQLGLSQITHVRLVDVPGNGSFTDSANHPIYDAWRTFGSGGFDLDAIGAVSVDMFYPLWPSLEKLAPGDRGETDDPDGDQIPNLLEYAGGLVPWEADLPSSGFNHALVSEAGSTFSELTTRRDERLVDLTREIQVSANMESWETIAVSTAGQPFQSANGHAVAITAESASTIASVGVLRRDRIRDLTPTAASPTRFYRLKVTRTSP